MSHDLVSDDLVSHDLVSDDLVTGPPKMLFHYKNAIVDKNSPHHLNTLLYEIQYTHRSLTIGKLHICNNVSYP